MAVEQQVTLGLHFYQPPRKAYHRAFVGINTDPQGVDWTRKITGECYKPLAQLGVLDKVSFDVYATLGTVLEDIDPATADTMRVKMVTNGMADSYIHALLPDLSLENKRILVGAGVKRFTRITGRNPRFFWLPEVAVDTETLEVLSEFGLEGFLCSPDQIVLNDGSYANNMPTHLRLPSGRNILALSCDRGFSRQLAFDDDPDHPLRANAYRFAEQVILPALGQLTNGFPLAAYTDGETFGHHMRWGGDFIATLVNDALPAYGVKVMPINEIDFENVTTVEGRVWDRSAWSCAHGDLARWHGRCDCCGGAEVGWKESFNSAFNVLNKRITQVIKRELGSSYEEMVIDCFDQAFRNPGPPLTTTELSLISAKVSALTALTSCGTFFGDPHASGKINTLHARVAVRHLHDAGLTGLAKAFWNLFLGSMAEVWDPTRPGKTGRDMTEELLGDRSYW